MDMPGKNVADNDRYAFLLGSALKNNDTEQFFCIYDSILPKDLSEAQLDEIKNQARYIADLPDDEFNDLVVNARDFSLARGRLSLPHSGAMSSTSGPHTFIQVTDDCGEEEDEGCGGGGSQPAGTSVPPLLLHNAPLLAAHKGSGAVMTDTDSGLPSSTKTGRRNSSSDDTDTSDMEGKGAFDYFPSGTQRKREVVSIRHTYNPPYDEEVAVESDKSSVESPRSETSSTREYDVTQLDSEELAGGAGTEMTTYSFERRSYEDAGENIHRSLYGRTTSSTAPREWESMERPRASSTSSINFSRSQPLLSQGQTISSLRSGNASGGGGRSVDDAVHFSGLTRYPPESRYSPDPLGSLPRPPFSPDKDSLLEKMGNSVSQLLSSTSYNLSQPSAGDALTTDGKKKKKKKKDGKDESSGSVTKPMSTDVNGNPLDTALYRSMRAPPGSNDSSTSRLPGSTNHHETSSGRGGLHDGLGMAKSEDGSSPSGTGSGPGDKRKNKKLRKPEVTVHSQEIPNYVGDIQNIDQLVSFINSDITEKKLKKIKKDSSGAAPATAVTPTPLAANKAVKKGKDRNKTKHSLTSSISDTHNSSLTPASETQQALSLPAENSATISPNSSLLESLEGKLSPDRAIESGTGQATGLDAGEMGNSSTSEKSGGEEERTSEKITETVPHSSQPVFKNQQYVSEKDAACALSTASAVLASERAKPDTNKSHKNHTLPSTVKSDAASKKEQLVEGKEAKDKGKTKNKEAGKETAGKIHTTDNNSSKKPKPKAHKNDVKSESGGERNAISISRSRSADGTRKVEADSERADEAGQDVITSNTPLVPKSPNNIDLAMESKDFIFTDVEIPQVEQEFTVVSKKKKRSPPQVPSHGQNNSFPYGHHYSRDSQYQSSQNFVPYTRNGPREFQYRPQSTKTRSCTPPPFSSGAMSEIVDKSRDLSPSAFPTLRKSTRSAAKVNPLGTDGRRRSLEELTLDTGQLLGYDSDKESVKSLPAVQGSSSARGAAYPVSYASMVATPRPSVDSSKAESVSSSTEGGGSGEWQSPVVWKGREGHERRHSIGSSPDDLAKTASSSLQGVRLRSGSQETLSREVAKDPADKDSAIGLPGSKGMCQSESAGSFADNASGGSDADSARGGSEAGSDPSDVFVPAIAAMVMVAESKKSNVVLGIKTNTIPGAVPNTPPQTATHGPNQGHLGVVRTAVAASPAGTFKAKSPQLGLRSQPVAASGPIQHSECASKASHTVAKTVNNGRKNKTSVIFLDKRFAEKPTNLDITFGFDVGDMEVSSVGDGGGGGVSVKDVSLGDTAVTAQSSPAVNVTDMADGSSGSNTSSTFQQSSQSAPSKVTSSSLPAPSSDANQLSKPAKGPHIAGLNGVVVPQRTEEKPIAAEQGLATVRAAPPVGIISTNIATVTTTSASSSASIDLSQTTVGGGAPVLVGSGPSPNPVISEAPSGKSQPDKSGPEAPPVLAVQPMCTLPDGCFALKLGEGLSSEKQSSGKSQQITFRLHKGLETSSTFNFAEAAGFFQKEWNKIEKLKEKDPAAVKVYSGE